MVMNDNDNHAVAGNSDPIRFLSVCSGIEAASVAWGPLGWRAVAFGEIDKAASRLLAYRYPETPNLGDFTAIDTKKLGRVDVFCGGTPCQAFSVAGARRGLDDDRGNLSLEFVRLAHELADGNGLRNAVWENVPGVLTMADNAFGCFLAGLVGADGPFVPVEPKPRDGKSSRWWRWAAKERRHAPRWPKRGMVYGPKGRAAWHLKNAQYFGLAQRRERVLVVADFGNGADPAEVLFERISMPWNPPARREAGEGVAGTTSARTAGGGGLGTDFDLAGGVQVHAVDVAPTVRAGGNSTGGDRPYGTDVDTADNLIAYAPDIARCVATREGSSQDYETTTMVAQAVCVTGSVTHTLTTEGADASEDGTGRGTPIVWSLMPQNSGKDFKARKVDVAQPLMASGQTHGNQGWDIVQQPIVSFGWQEARNFKVEDNPTSALTKNQTQAICFTAKDYGADAQVDIAPTLRAGGHKDSHQNGGVGPAVAFNYKMGAKAGGVGCAEEQSPTLGTNGNAAVAVSIRGREGGATAELGGSVATALRASSGGGDKPHVLTSAVRRLTPKECERLQGFPDDYTRIPVKWYAVKKVTKNRPDDMWDADPNGGWWLMQADGPRYKQLGNSWAVPKFTWLGRRIQQAMPARQPVAKAA